MTKGATNLVIDAPTLPAPNTPSAVCPNQTGQRAQAEWGLYRCQVGDFDRGLAELERLLGRNLIPLP